MERSADHDSIPAYDPSNDPWDDLGYPKGTPAPAAHQSSASVDVMQGENSSKAKASNPWSTSLILPYQKICQDEIKTSVLSCAFSKNDLIGQR